jgi:hypothetical protein
MGRAPFPSPAFEGPSCLVAGGFSFHCSKVIELPGYRADSRAGTRRESVRCVRRRQVDTATSTGQNRPFTGIGRLLSDS